MNTTHKMTEESPFLSTLTTKCPRRRLSDGTTHRDLVPFADNAAFPCPVREPSQRLEAMEQRRIEPPDGLECVSNPFLGECVREGCSTAEQYDKLSRVPNTRSIFEETKRGRGTSAPPTTTPGRGSSSVAHGTRGKDWRRARSIRLKQLPSRSSQRCTLHPTRSLQPSSWLPRHKRRTCSGTGIR